MESFTPVSYDFRDVLDAELKNGTTGKIFFWSPDSQVDEQIGRITEIADRAADGIFVVLDNGGSVRIDRIITLFGKPGPGYEAYDSFANQCLSCTAGVPL